MSRILPYPGLSLALAALWLLLNNSVAPATLVGATLVGLLAPLTLLALGAPRPRLRSLSAAARLAGVVLVDIVRSNIAVATIILGGGRARRRSGFVSVPLELRNQYSLGLLALIITSTPGTLWAQYNGERDRLLLHVLDLVDDETWIRLIKGRYEPLLKEMFE